jgi:hypothetical protein
MANRLVDDGTTPVRDKVFAAGIVHRLRCRLPIGEPDVSVLHQLYRRRRDALAAAAAMFAGFS